jgi:hypothetical protein
MNPLRRLEKKLYQQVLEPLMQPLRRARVFEKKLLCNEMNELFIK